MDVDNLKVRVTIDPEYLKTCHLFIATPMYGGMCHGQHMTCVMDLTEQLKEYGVKTTVGHIYTESLITRARNRLAYVFLEKTDCTHLLFLDSDIVFDSTDIIAMLGMGLDVVAAPYAKKSFQWENIREAAVKGASAADLPTLGGDVNCNFLGDKFDIFQPIEVSQVATGVMLIRRDVLVSMREKMPQIRLSAYPSEQELGIKESWAFFDTGIEPETGYYLSEDYEFCRRWKALGGKVWLCPWMKTDHIGTQFFRCDIPRISAMEMTVNKPKNSVYLERKKHDNSPRTRFARSTDNPGQERDVQPVGDEGLCTRDSTGDCGCGGKESSHPLSSAV